MKLNAREDIEAPLAFVFDALADFDGWERAAMRRGADVVRKPGPARAWQVAFPFRGKTRSLAVTLTRLDKPQRMEFLAEGMAVEGALDVDLVELGPRRTRVTVVTEVKPRSLGARIFLQSVKLAKGKITKRFSGRVALIAADIEDRYKRSLRG